MLDLNDASIKKMIARAKKRGVVTYEELNQALPQDQMSSEQIEDVMSALNDMGINVVESAEAATTTRKRKRRTRPPPRTRSIRSTTAARAPRLRSRRKPIDRTDDPVRMYLREMGAVELLSREGEIAIAKRIEAGRDIMIWGLCESPMTFNAIIGWSNALNEGRMQLREILDLEAMLSKGPTAEQIAATEEGGENAEGEISEKVAGPSIKEEEEVADEPEAGANEDDEDMVERRTQPQAEEEDEDNTLSLAQMEETLKPQALEKFAEHHLAVQEVQQGPGDAHGRARDDAGFPRLRREEVPEAARAAHRRGRKRPVPRLEDRISGRALYSYNRRLTGLGGQMLRLAERHKVPRRAFLESYMGHELDESWLKDVSKHRQEMGRLRHRRARHGRAHPRRDRRHRPGDRHLAHGIPAHRQHGPEGASARRASPRRKWSRPTSASSSRSPRNTPTAACSSSTSSRKAISA